MGKDLKIKLSVYSPPYKVWGNLFTKKLGMGKQIFLAKFLGGCFTWGLMIRSCNREVNGQEVPKVKSSQFFLSLTLIWVIDILFDILFDKSYIV